MRTLRLFERVTIVMAVLLVATLVGCLRYDMERMAATAGTLGVIIHRPKARPASPHIPNDDR
jgi:hypothetical protein